MLSTPNLAASVHLPFWQTVSELTAFVSTFPHAFLAVDNEGIIRRANPALCALLGYAATQLIGQPYQRFLSPPSCSRARRTVRADAVTTIASYIRQDGVIVHCEISHYPLYDEAGGYQGELYLLAPYNPTATGDERLSEEATWFRQEQIAKRAADAERARIGHDLHDSVTQTLFAATMLADLLPQIWESDPELGRAKLEELRRISADPLAEMRILLIELRPDVVEESDLGRLLHQLVDALVGRTPLTAAVTVNGDLDHLPADVRVAFYRIAQEALNNVVRHADANRVTVDLQSTPKLVELGIGDDGQGFADKHVHGDHFGLRNMHERAAAISAQLLIHSQPSQGTEIQLQWRPLESV